MPLSDITVLDLSRVLSGPFATQQLIDLGAQVIKIERPGKGDDTRAFGPPFVEGESTYFMSVNRGKRSVAIDLKSEKGRDIVLQLAKTADVVVENFKPGTAERLGLGQEKLRELNPRLITCSISGYGGSGDPEYAGRGGYDAIIQAACGIMSLTGTVDGPPSKVGVAVSDMIAGLFAAQGLLAALFARERTQRGRHVEISMQDAMCTMMTYQAGSYFATGNNPRRMGDAHPSICPYETIATEDGPFVVAVGNDRQFVKLAKLIEMPELSDDPRFATNASRVENRPALLEILGPAMRAKSRSYWDKAFADVGIPGGPVLELSRALEHPQLKARGSVLEHDHPVAGRIRTVASPVRFDGVAPSSIAAPPTLGADTQSVLQKLGLTEDQIQALVDDDVVA